MEAADVMTPQVITVAPDASIFQAIRLMLQNRISGLLVMDAKGRLVGIVTEGDFFRRAETGTERRRSSWMQFFMSSGDLADEYVHTHGRKVEDVMSRKLQTVSEQATLEEIVRTMERASVKRVPVLRGGKLVGIITRANLMRALATAARTIPPLAVDDVAIRARVLSELEKTLSKGTAGVSVLVREGSVELFGTILDERLRKALRVLVENGPGVKAIHDHIVLLEPYSGMEFASPEDKTRPDSTSDRESMRTSPQKAVPRDEKIKRTPV